MDGEQDAKKLGDVRAHFGFIADADADETVAFAGKAIDVAGAARFGGGFAGGSAMPASGVTATRAALVAPQEEAEALMELQEDMLFDTEADGLVALGDKLQMASKKRSALGVEENFIRVRGGARELSRRFFIKLEPTKEWAENNYWHLRIQQQLGELIAVNGFWNDYAAHLAGGAKGPFLSTHLPEATGNFAEIMLALAVLDLPFGGEAIDKAEAVDGDIVLTLKRPVILFHQEVREGEEAKEKTPILVAQNFYRADDRYTHENNERFDKFVRDEFLRQVVYGCQVILTNPGSSRQKLDAMLQIPRGAIPVRSGFQTRGVHQVLEPFGTATVEYHFYFPESGEFVHFPVNVAVKEELVARAEPLVFQVVDEPSEVDETSWAWISQNAEPDAVIGYLERHNLNRIDLDRIAWRMKDQEFFGRTMALLDQRFVYHHTLWSYGVHHRDVARARDYLQHTPFPERCGLWLASALLDIDPVARHTHEHLEYDPLVNKRAHQLGRRRHIANHALHQQYHRLLKVLSYRPRLDDTDRLAVAYYLALQDRIAEAMAFFEQTDRAKVAGKMQHDYLGAWLAISEERLDHARQVALAHKDHPVDKWRQRFTSLLNQLDEKIEVVDDEDRDQQQDALAGTEPVIQVSVVDRDVEVDHRNLPGATVNLYPMDIELLFSRNPFVKDQSAAFTYVKPAFVQELPFAADETQSRFAIPQKFRNRNLMVELVAGGVRDSAAVYANDLTVNVMDNYGQVQVLHRGTRDALSKTYVKVYARMADGRAEFFKDGYTDFRGRFDYVSLNSTELGDVQEFALLILHPEFGATILETEPPKQ